MSSYIRHGIGSTAEKYYLRPKMMVRYPKIKCSKMTVRYEIYFSLLDREWLISRVCWPWPDILPHTLPMSQHYRLIHRDAVPWTQALRLGTFMSFVATRPRDCVVAMLVAARPAGDLRLAGEISIFTPP